MLRRLLSSVWSRLFVGAAVLHVAGLHWVLLQMVAWTGMLAVNVPQSGLSEGLADTFSGEKPCALCCAIAEGRESEQEEEPAALREAKRDVFPVTERVLPALRSISRDGFVPITVDALTRPVSWNRTPEPPPPRASADLRSV